jgi:hypothetical protein
MFVGHFAVGLAAKRAAPRASLPVLLAAPQVLDILWPIFVATGIEHARIVPGAMPASPLVIDYMPYSHSLVSALALALAVGVGWALVRRDRRTAVVLAILVLSHWVLDWIAHAPDMPIFSGHGPRYGLGLWNSVPGTLAVELGLFAVGVAIYASATRARDRIGAIGWWALAGGLALAEVAVVLGPPPPDIDALVAAAFGVFAILPLAWWIDRHRETIVGPRSATAVS